MQQKIKNDQTKKRICHCYFCRILGSQINKTQAVCFLSKLCFVRSYSFIGLIPLYLKKSIFSIQTYVTWTFFFSKPRTCKQLSRTLSCLQLIYNREFLMLFFWILCTGYSTNLHSARTFDLNKKTILLTVINAQICICPT